MRFARAGLCGATLLLAAVADAATPELPVPNVALELTAPSPRGPWTVRIVNQDERRVRIPADVRLLRLSVTPPEEDAKPVVCAIPPPLRPRGFPDARALYLDPGQMYEERFDPLLFCFGDREAKALVGGAEVRAFFGWPEAPGKKPETPGEKKGPFAVEGLAFPPEVASLGEIAAPPATLGPGDTDETERAHAGGGSPVTSSRGEAIAEAPDEVDELAPRLALDAPRFVGAGSRQGLVMRVYARNAGHRPMRIVLRDRMLRVAVEGPGGSSVHCAVPSAEHDATPRQLFRTIPPGGRVALSARLDELCEHDAFRRPGLYRVTATLRADETDEARGVPAFTGTATADHPTLVRVLAGDEPFYASKPEAKPAD